MKKKFIFAIGYSLVLITFTVYTLMDTFVISNVHSGAVDNYSALFTDEVENTLDNSSAEEQNELAEGEAATENPSNVENESEAPNADDSTSEESNKSSDAQIETPQETPKSDVKETPQAVEQTENHYKDANIEITLTEHRQNDTTIYVADVKIASMKYFKTALAKNSYGRNVTETTSTMAKNNNAILAINGDYYGARNEGYVIRNGTLYRDSSDRGQEDLVIKTDGSFSIINESDTSAQALVDAGVAQVFSFGPALIDNGNIAVDSNDEVGKAKASNPRTAIGIIDNLHYVFVVADGRTNESEGLSLLELANFMQTLGVSTAYNLDGGGSSTMYFNGRVINNPTSNGKSIKERSVSDIVYIGL